MASSPPLNAEQLALYERITAFRFDEAEAAFPFVARLARENGWSRGYAIRTLTEYRRFAFLALVAGQRVSPSDQVDQVWHLHLLYTRSYWDRFCKDTLRHPLHHGPTKGGQEEKDKFGRWYAATLDSYRRLLGEDAPADIWPPPDVRSREDLRFQRVNRARFLVISKARLSAGIGLAGAIVAGLVFAIW